MKGKIIRFVVIGINGAYNLSEEAASGIYFYILPFDHGYFRLSFISHGIYADGVDLR